MKKTIIAILALCMLSAAAPLLAEEMNPAGQPAAGSTDAMTPTEQKTRQDECLLYSKKCMDNVDSLQERMKKLDAEIQKGTTKYSPEELKRLEQKLKEANDTLDYLLHH